MGFIFVVLFINEYVEIADGFIVCGGQATY